MKNTGQPDPTRNPIDLTRRFAMSNHSYVPSLNKTLVNMSQEYEIFSYTLSIIRFESRTLFSFLSYERRTLVSWELTNYAINIKKITSLNKKSYYRSFLV